MRYHQLGGRSFTHQGGSADPLIAYHTEPIIYKFSKKFVNFVAVPRLPAVLPGNLGTLEQQMFHRRHREACRRKNIINIANAFLFRFCSKGAVPLFAKGMSNAKHWLFTLNNPVRPFPTLESVGRDCSYLVYQLEVGAAGTPHLQGFVSFETKIRLAPLKALFPGAHLEVARGTPRQNTEYCSKPDTRVEGPFAFGVEPAQKGPDFGF